MAKNPETKVKFSIFNKEFRDGINEINKDTAKLRKEFKLEQEQMKHTSTESGKLEQNIKRLGKEKENVQKKTELTEKQLKRAKEYYGENSDEVRRLENQLLDLRISEQKIENAMEDSRVEIEKQSSALSDGVGSAEKYRESLAKIGQSAEDMGKKMQDVGRGMSDFGRSWSMRVTAPIAATGGAAFKLASDWESSWVGVEKVVDGTDEELTTLRQNLRDMTKELPATHTEIAEVAATAGQLGIATEDIESFSRVMLDLGVATNMSAEDAATSLARLANITGMSAEDYDKLGATVVDLGNNLATTEKEIVEMGLRLAGAGKQVGMTEDQTLALAGALSSVGIRADAGGSAFSKVMVNMQLAVETGGESLEAFADVAGVSADDFAKAYEEDAAGALLTFIEGLSTAEDRGLSAIGMLDEMGISEVRMRDALLRAAGASDLFSDSLEIGSKAWEENIALTEEAEKRYETTESKLKIMWNRIKDVGITLGEALIPAVMDALDAMEPFIEKIEDGAEAFSAMDEDQQRTILKLIGLVAAIGPASIALGGLTTTVGGLVRGGGKLTGLLGRAGGAGLIARLGMLGPAGVAGLAIAGIAGLSAVIYNLARDKEELNDISFETADAHLAEHESNEKLIKDFDELRKKSLLSNDEFARYVDLQSELKSASDPEVISAIKDEMTELEEKSGYSNDELSTMVDLNNDITESLPGATEQITEQGNKIAGTTSELEKYNSELLKLSTLELEKEFYEALENQGILLNKQVDKQKELEQSKENVALIEDVINQYNQGNAELAQEQLDTEFARLKKLVNTGKVRGKELEATEKLSTINRDISMALKDGDGALNEQLIKHLGIKNEQESELVNIQQQLKEFDIVTQRLQEHYLTSQGISEEKARQAIADGKQIEAIDTKIASLRDEKIELQHLHDKGQILTDEYDEQKAKIDGQIDGLENSKGKIGDLVNLASDYNDELKADIEKNVLVKTNFDGKYRRLTDPAYKSVNITTTGGGHHLPVTGYAEGTSNHPGGPAIVGEKGPELIREGRKWSLADLGMYNLKRGAQVFTADQTEKLLNGIRRMPAYVGGAGVSPEMARGLDRVSSNLADRQQNINNSMVVNIGTSDVVLDGRKVGSIIWKPVKENIDRDNKVKEDFRG